MIDEIYDADRVTQFADELKHVPKEVVEYFESLFADDKELAFYEGLLSGVAFSYSLVKSSDTFSNDLLGALVAFISAKLKYKRLK